MMNKRTFLFLYEFLKIGGIEKNLIDMIKAYHEMGMRIIWIRYGNPDDIYEPWKVILKECDVEIVDADISFWFSHEKIVFDSDEEIWALCFDPTDFVRLEELAHEYDNRFKMFYMVPHFERDLNYVEEYYFNKYKRRNMVNILSKHYKEWFDNGNILFFDKRHWVEMNDRYAIGGSETYNEFIYKAPITVRPFDEELVRKKYYNGVFRIITCGRFNFPHKGYMFGLIRDFVTLKDEYPNIVLDIVGYGSDEDERKIRSFVDALEDKYKKSITFVGAVGPEKMLDYYDKSNLNIAVAGGIIEGAKAGVLSIPARHYSYDCEVYGMLDGDLGIVVSDNPGMDAKPFIEKVLTMTEEEYIQACKSSYTSVISGTIDKFWLFNRNNKKSSFYSEEDINLFKRIYKKRKLNNRLKNIIKKIFMPLLKKLKIYSYCANKWKTWKKRH